MLAIRLQRTGRSGHAQFRLIAQDSRFSPSSGRITAYLGNYDPHTKKADIDKEKISQLLDKGAQPSDRAVRLLEAEGLKMPSWVAKPVKKQGEIRHPDKLRRNRPADAPAPEPKAEPAPEAEASPEAVAEAPAETNEAPASEAPTEEKAEKPATEPETPVEEKPAAAETKPENTEPEKTDKKPAESEAKAAEPAPAEDKS